MILSNTMKWMIKSFEDKKGKPDGRAITVALSFIMLCIMAVGEQWFGKIVKESIFDCFYYLVIIGLGVLSPSIVNKIPIKLNYDRKNQEQTPSSNGSDNGSSIVCNDKTM